MTPHAGSSTSRAQGQVIVAPQTVMAPDAQGQTATAAEAQNEAASADPLAVRWAMKYSDHLEAVWARLPNWLGSLIACVAVFAMGSTVRAEWLLILVHFIKYLRYPDDSDTGTDNVMTAHATSTDELPAFSLERYRLQNLFYYWVVANVVGYTVYLGVGGFLHWYYYIQRRNEAEKWKCQPKKFLPPDLERHEIALGSLSLFVGNSLSSVMSCYIMNGGETAIYYGFSEYGWLWWFLSWPVTFVWQDYLTYWHHRLYHWPFFYKHFHKLHHKYKQPTAFSVTAIHPVEFVHMQLIIASPMFLFPVHWLTFCVLIAYIYYHGIVDHSGINFKAHWWQPWQPDCLFHDNHHQYFHVNFGFNTYFWDVIHGTARQKDRVYREDVFFGRGKKLEDCTEDELVQEVMERTSENALAFSSVQVKQDMIAEVEKIRRPKSE